MPLLILLLVLAVEGAGIWLVGELIQSLGLAIWLAIGTSFIGISVLQGARQRLSPELMTAAMSRPDRPGRVLVDALAPVAGGMLLVFPGFVTDLVGVCCLFRPTRRLLGGLLRFLLKALIQRQLGRGAPPGLDPEQLREMLRQRGLGGGGETRRRPGGERVRDADFEVLE